MKKKILFPILPALLICCIIACIVVHNRQMASVCNGYSMSLPEGYTLETQGQGKNGTILRQGVKVGGVVNCPYACGFLGLSKPEMVLGVPYVTKEDTISTLKHARAPGTVPGVFDYMDYVLEGQIGSLAYASFVNKNAEYDYVLYYQEKGILALWLDAKLVEGETRSEIIGSFIVEP